MIGKTKISQGGVWEAPADLRVILKAAINSTCHGMLLCHNHPSGNIRPSKGDDALTFRLKEAAELMQMRLLDHIILSDKSYYSYADEGRL